MGTQMRKAFNFYRSYYDVLEDMDNPLDQLSYLKALLERQFTGKQPELTGISKIVYNGQKHSIDKSVEGYESKTKTKLSPPTQGGTEGPTEGGSEGPSEGSSEGGTEGPMEGKVPIGPYGYGVTTEGSSEGSSEGPTEDPSVQEQEEEQEKEEEEEKEQEEEFDHFSKIPDVENYIDNLIESKEALFI